jgi:hypothetical protein
VTAEEILVLAVGIGIVSAVAAGAITAAKGRGAGIGVVLGLLLGVIGLIIAAVLPRTEGAMVQAARRECPHCKELMRRDASVCPRCQRESPAWQFHEGRWWTKNEQGHWFWLHEPSRRWTAAKQPSSQKQ